MYPDVHLLGIHVPSHLAMLGLAVLVCHWVGPWAAERLEHIPRSTVRLILVWLGIAAFVGGRAHFVWNSWSFGTYASNPSDILAFWRGLHAGGALVALAAALPLVCRFYGVSTGRFIDALSPTIAIGIAVARIGCFLQGCCFGIASDAPWAVPFPAGSPVMNFQTSAGLVERGSEWSTPVHPLQLYFAGAGLLAAYAGLRIYQRRLYSGRVALVVASVYLSLSAVAEMVRAPYYPQLYFWGARLQFEWIAIAMALVVLIAFAWAESRYGLAALDRNSSDIKRARL